MTDKMVLLEETRRISNKFYIENKGQYNIFKVLEVWDKEVVMCRWLTDILNPKGSHNKGTKYLKSFLEKVLCVNDLTEFELNKMSVHKEYLIENERRIDIVIKSEKYFIPIEVKIYAGEQKSQCYDYYLHAIRFDKNAKVIYLTVEGTRPSLYSTQYVMDNKISEVPEERIICISFSNDIRLWLESLLEEEEGIIKEIFKQYIEAIETFSGRPKKELMMQLSGEISSNEGNLRSALHIVSAINQAKANVINSVMVDLEEAMEDILDRYGLEKETKINWYQYKDKATEAFYSTYSTYPGINYKIKNIKLNNGAVDLWFRIEIEHCLFAGFCLFNHELENKHDDISGDLQSEIEKHFKIPLENTESWWILWRYLPTGLDNKKVDGDEIPNFKTMNDAAIELADYEKRKKFVTKAINSIENNLLSLLKRKDF